jgi:hypothetical protein
MLSFGLVFVMAVQIVALLGYLSPHLGFTVTDQELLQKRTIFKQSLTLWKSNGHARQLLQGTMT